MNTDKTEIVVVLDRSGSMQSIKADMEGGFNTFIKEQSGLPGACRVTLYQFDTQYDTVYEGKDIKEVNALELVPRGGTALLDAVGKSIAKTIDRHAAMKEEDRPAAVIFLIITDGHENQSKEWTKEKVQAAIKDAEDNRKWQMVFLAANAAAFDGAHDYGFRGGKFAGMKSGTKGIQDGYAATSSAVGGYREQVRSGNLRGASLSLDSSAFDKSKEKDDDDDKPSDRSLD